MFHYLEPRNLHLELAPDGTLRAQITDDRCGLRVEVLRAFPISNAAQNLVLRDGGGKELGVLQDLTGLDAQAQNLIESALASRYFLPKILKINSIFERFGSAVWQVETDRGPVSITSKAMHEAIYEITPNRFLLRDTEENRYEIADVGALDEASQKRFLGKV
ncbi:MAG TPA: DUF1854 domain-containing protein [Abditibacterium sp.]|jgi:hypothetical protein